MLRTLVSWVAFLAALAAPTAHALTNVPPGTIDTPATWTLAGSPYRLSGDVTVTSSLTIQANVVVQFAPTDSTAGGVDPARVEVLIQGPGDISVGSNVRFESQFAPASAVWYGIRIQGGGAAIAAGTIIRHAVNGVHIQNLGPNVNLSGLNLSLISECGLRYDSGQVTAQNITATQVGAAVCLNAGTTSAAISGLTVTDSTNAVKATPGVGGSNYGISRLTASRLVEAVTIVPNGGGGNISVDTALLHANTTAFGVRAPGMNLAVRNATIANNRTSVVLSAPNQVFIANSQVTFHQNAPQVTQGSLIVQYSNYFQSGNEQAWANGEGMRSGEPAFAGAPRHDYASGTGDYHLTVTSAGVNRGLNGFATSGMDLGGAQRPFAFGATDMGAYELQGPAVQAITVPVVPQQQATTPPFNPQATASSGLQVLYESLSPTICTVDVDNLVVVVGRNGACNLRLTQPGNGEWAAAPQQFLGFNVAGAAPRVQVTPPQLDFGPHPAASFTVLPVTVRNIGYMPMAVAAFVNDAAFQGVLALAVNECPSTLPEQQECQVFISFNPMGVNDYTANLRINTNDPQAPQVVVPLAGRVPPPDVTPDAFAFNTVSNATPGAVQVSNTVTITGIETAVLAVVTNGEFSVGCSGNWQTFMNIVANGQAICVRHTAPLALNATTTTSLQVGTVSRTFVTTTIATLPAGGDYDHDGIPNEVEASVGRNPLVKDNAIFGDLQLFVMQMYRDFLGREADAAGQQYFTDLIGTGAASREEAIALFLASPEFQAGLPSVIRLYFSFFDRIPDAGGLQFQVEAARAGTPLEAIAQNFYNSPEFTSRFGALSNDDYINLVYQQVLGRAPDAGGFQYYKNLLDTNAITKGQMMIGFSESPEFQQLTSNEVYVVSVYFGLLRRTPEPSGLDFYADLLDQGLPRVQVLPGFFNSPEYRSRFLP